MGGIFVVIRGIVVMTMEQCEADVQMQQHKREEQQYSLQGVIR